MNIVGVTACTVGIAHTYMAREKLMEAGKRLGIEVRLEAQGSAGIEFPLTEEEIKAADLVLFCVDIGVTGKERFKGKPIVEVPTKLGIKSPENLLTKIREQWEAH